MDLTFYNKDGRAIAYLHGDGESIFFYDGRPAGYLMEGAVYHFDGAFLGWFENGWIIDREGNHVFFTETSAGGPSRPLRQPKPVPTARQLPPLRVVRETRPLRRTKMFIWSGASSEIFFEA